MYLETNGEDFTRTYPKNTMIFSENEPGTELYIIQRGVVKISKIVEDNEVMLAMLKPGDIFGEMALLENKPRSASAIANEDVSVMVVNQEPTSSAWCRPSPSSSRKLTTLLAERLWLIYKQLANTLIQDPLGPALRRAAAAAGEEPGARRRGRPYTFHFGPKELLNMVGLSAEKGNPYIKKMFENKKMKLAEQKIATTDVEEIQKQSEYYKKMEKIERARRKAAASALEDRLARSSRRRAPPRPKRPSRSIDPRHLDAVEGRSSSDVRLAHRLLVDAQPARELGAAHRPPVGRHAARPRRGPWRT